MLLIRILVGSAFLFWLFASDERKSSIKDGVGVSAIGILAVIWYGFWIYVVLRIIFILITLVF